MGPTGALAAELDDDHAGGAPAHAATARAATARAATARVATAHAATAHAATAHAPAAHAAGVLPGVLPRAEASPHPPPCHRLVQHSWFYEEFVKDMYASVRCYDPQRDILMPVYTSVPMLGRAAALKGGATDAGPGRCCVWDDERRVWRREETAGTPSGVRGGVLPPAVPMGRHGWLLHFRGQVHPGGNNYANYSFGIRQQALALFGGRTAEGLLVDERHSGQFISEMLNSTFCAVLPGNGWGHIEAPVMMGCIPVIVQDQILSPWEDVLDFSQFALRVPRAQLPDLPDILRRVPEARIRQLQRGLARVWERFTYSSLALAEVGRRCEAGDCPSSRRNEAYLSHPALTGRDAVDTLMHVLKARLAKRMQREAATAG